jgi:AraC family transcriptional regulator
LPLSLTPTLQRGEALLLAGIRQTHRFAEAPRDIPLQWQAFLQLRGMPPRRNGVNYGAICATNARAQTMEYMCAMEIGDFAGLPEHIGRMRIPEQNYAVFTHHGHVSEIRDTWAAIWSSWLPASGMTIADTPDFERYDESFDSEAGRGGITIWLPVAKR